jgi:sugar phosphate isomerase/epimerase
MDNLIDRVGVKVNHIHVKENKGKGAVNFVCFGEGDTDHRNVITRLAGIGYEGFVTIEISPRKDRPTTVEDMILAHHEINDIICGVLK